MQSPALYICLEGMKGAGKSTLLAAAGELLTAHGIGFGLAAPTRPAPASQSWRERLSRRWPVLRCCDNWNEGLYAHRARHAAATADWHLPLVLGDRSLVTSYVTRWHKWGCPSRCIARVDRLEQQLPAPHHVILLDVPPELAWLRTQARRRSYGQVDETLCRLREAYAAYQQIRQFPVPRLAATQWHVLDARQPASQLLQEWAALMQRLAPTLIPTTFSSRSLV